MNMRDTLLRLFIKKEQLNCAAQTRLLATTPAPRLDRLDFLFCPACDAAVPKTAKQCLVCKPASNPIHSTVRTGN